MTSLLQELLLDRVGHEELPEDVGPDPDPNEPPDEHGEPEPERMVPRRVLHLTDADFVRASDILNVQVAAIRAVAEIEAASRGFLSDGRPQILYEAHVFGRLTNHRFIDIRDRANRLLSTRSWDRTTYGAAGAWQHDERLAPAAKLDWDAAHQACSWGYFQVMGFNHQISGFPTIRAFVEAMHFGAGPHLDAMVRFIRHNGLDRHLRNRDWAGFARGYNGPGFAQNQYDTKLAAAYARWSGAGSDTPILRQGSRGPAVTRLQRILNNISGGQAPLRDDGVFGPLTETEVKAFQYAEGLADDGVVGPLTWAALAQAEKEL
jgi:hypothetical protein